MKIVHEIVNRQISEIMKQSFLQRASFTRGYGFGGGYNDGVCQYNPLLDQMLSDVFHINC
jgi:hypothetical protein